MTARARDTATYLVGYVLALALTCVAFAAVIWWHVSATRAITAVFVLAVVQVIVQFRCFLNIGLRRSSRQDLLLVLFASVIVVLMVGGTLWIIFDLRYRMM